MTTVSEPRPEPAIVSSAEWLAARKRLLNREKEADRLRDQISAERRSLPWRKVEKPYVFESPDGPRTLADLFGGHSQLVIYHFMFGPDWQEGCPSCSFVSDHFDGALLHLAARDVALVAVSRASLVKLEAFKTRMGWKFPWVSSGRSDFNTDFQVSFSEEEVARGEVTYNYQLQGFPSTEAPGVSVFAKSSDGPIFHTYSTYGRGVEVLMGTYRILDLVPKGRNEKGLRFPMEWVRYHDRYDPEIPVGREQPSRPTAACGCEWKQTSA